MYSRSIGFLLLRLIVLYRGWKGLYWLPDPAGQALYIATRTGPIQTFV
jgi:hypothetical protein